MPNYIVIDEATDFSYDVWQRAVARLKEKTLTLDTLMQADAESYTGPLRLRGYQEVGRNFLWERKRVMLADDAGLGKTAQAAYAAETPCLVVAPKYLTRQWFEWLTGTDPRSRARNASTGMVIPNVKGSIILVEGSRDAKARAIFAGATWTVISMDTLRTHLSALVRVAYKTMILDESHHYRHWKAQRTRAALEVGQLVDRVYELTASPVMKEVDDYYSQLRILDPKTFKSYWRFAATFCELEQNEFGTKVVGFKDTPLVRRKLDNILNWYMLRRDYASAGREVPSIVTKYVSVELPRAERVKYVKALLEYENHFDDARGDDMFLSWMEMFNYLRRSVTGQWKLDVIPEILQDVQGRVIFFTWYQDTARAVANAVRDTGAPCECITGELGERLRRELALGGSHVAATIASLSEGIDLSDARTVVFFEEDFVPGNNYQALRRVVRERVDGDNAAPVIVYYVHVANTIDSTIHMRAQGRAATIQEVVRAAVSEGRNGAE